MGKKKIYLIITAVILLGIIGAVAVLVNLPSGQASGSSGTDLSSDYGNFSRTLETQLAAIDAGLAVTAEKLAGIPADDPEVTRILMDIYAGNPSIISLYRVDETGSVTATVPTPQTKYPEYRISAEYLDPALSETIIDALYNPLTKTYDTVIIVPVISGDGTHHGFILAVADVQGFLLKILADSGIEGADYDVIILSSNDRILYASEGGFIGTNAAAGLKNDSSYAGLTPAIAETASGSAQYTSSSYGQLQTVNRDAVWDTESYWGSRKVILLHDAFESWNIELPVATSDKALEQFAIEAFRYQVRSGKETALAEFNNPNGRFNTREYMIAAFTTNGTALALPFRPGVVGTDVSTALDTYSVPIFKMGQMRALQGGGYTLSLYPNPADRMEPGPMLSYVIPVDDTWFIMAQTFLEDEVIVDPGVKYELSTFTRSLHQFISATGKDAAVAALNDETGSQLSEAGIRYLAMDRNGTLLVFPDNPVRIGHDAMGITDAYGSSIMRDLMVYAQEGGGFMYQNVPDPATGLSSLHLAYVEPIDDDWFIAATIPLTA
jgi:hypothetical protein